MSLLAAAVFDGHGGVSAGQYLCKELYSVLSDAIDEETYGEECSLEGAPARAPTAACGPCVTMQAPSCAHGPPRLPATCLTLSGSAAWLKGIL